MSEQWEVKSGLDNVAAAILVLAQAILTTAAKGMTTEDAGKFADKMCEAIPAMFKLYGGMMK